MKYTFINLRERIKTFLKKFKKYPKLYAKILYAAAVASKYKRIMQYGNSSAFSCTISKSRRHYESNCDFDKNIKFSILVPLYNTPKKFLKEMIDSVKGQTYGNFELCLADGSDDRHSYVEAYCLKEADKDSRIKYKKLAENKGISENTNECIKMATGEYIALFDHDDVLHPSALFECMRAVCEQGADYIYTDEATFLGKNRSNIISFHFKPDFAADNLLANNYICHFSVFKASLVEKSGMFRHQYDGSQDHDMILRLTDEAQKVVHIPKLLYFWRSHANSVAMDINSKPYAIIAGRSAVHDFLESKGFDTKVESSPIFPTVYRITYKIIGNPKVSIIIQYDGDLKALDKCLQAITTKTSYDNYEIIIVSGQNFDSETSDYCVNLKQNEKIRIYTCDNSLNCPRIYNYAALKAEGEYLLFVNQKALIITDEWLQELIMYAQRDDVGAVSGKLLLPDETVLCGGVIIGLGKHKAAGYAHNGADKCNLGYLGKLFYAQNVSAVTSDCLMVKKSKFCSVDGFDENQNKVYYDVDFCLKLRQKGLVNVFNPFCSLYCSEAQNGGLDAEYIDDIDRFKKKWKKEIEKGDPYYNPNFSLDCSYVFDFKE